jgi:hypothetical protein
VLSTWPGPTHGTNDTATTSEDSAAECVLSRTRMARARRAPQSPTLLSSNESQTARKDRFCNGAPKAPDDRLISSWSAVDRPPLTVTLRSR